MSRCAGDDRASLELVPNRQGPRPLAQFLASATKKHLTSPTETCYKSPLLSLRSLVSRRGRCTGAPKI